MSAQATLHATGSVDPVTTGWVRASRRAMVAGMAAIVLAAGALAAWAVGAPLGVVVLDEPNACLDTAGEQALAHTLTDLRAARVTVILVTQRTQVLALADRILVLRDGTLERIGVRQDKSGSSDEPAAANGAAVPVLQPV